MKLLIKQSMWYTLGIYVSNFINLLFWIIYAKWLNPCAFDNISLSMATAMLIGLLLSFSFDYSILKLVPNEKKILGGILLLHSLILICFALIMILLNIEFHIEIVRISQQYYPFIILLIVLLSLWISLSAAALSIINSRNIFVSSLIGSLTRLVLPPILISLVRDIVLDLLLSISIGVLVEDLTLGILIRRDCPMAFLNMKISAVRNIFKLSLVNYPFKLFRAFSFYLAPYLLSFTKETTGSISALYMSLTILSVLSVMPVSVALTSLPISESKKDETIFISSFKVSVGLSLILMGIVIAGSSYILAIFNTFLSRYSTSLRILAIIILFMSIINNTMSVLNYKNLFTELACLGIIQFISFIVLDLVLVKLYASYLAVIDALVLSLLITVILSINYLRNFSEVIVKSLIIASLQYCLIFILSIFISRESIVSLFIYELSTLIVTVSLLHFLKILRINDLISIFKITFLET